jgi:hypothetical protein
MRVENLEPLVNLEKLCLGGNKVEDYSDLISLSHIPSLTDLSLTDTTFGTNAVTTSEGYQSFVLCHLKSLKSLDGVSINCLHRSQAEEHYMSKVLEFNERIDSICRDNERELVALEARRKRNSAVAKEMEDDLLSTFEELEKVVIAGRRKVEDEERRQVRMRDVNLKSFHDAASALKESYASEVARIASKSTSVYNSRVNLLNFMKKRVLCEKELAIFAATVSSKASSRSIVHEVAPHTPDFRLVVALALSLCVFNVDVANLCS